MAAAEARTAWQRAANRYFVQEDAKRAPKLACCQSSASSSKKVDSGLANIADGLDGSAIGFIPSNKNSAYSNLPPDAKWWLHTQPNYGLQRVLNLEQFEAKPLDVEKPPATVTSDSQIGKMSKMSEKNLVSVDSEDLVSFFDAKKQPHSKLQEMDVIVKKVDQDFVDLKNMTDYYEFMEMEIIGGTVTQATEKPHSKADSSWNGDEMASFVAQKSLYHVENCDLPPPQKMLHMREPFKQAKSVDYDEIFLSSTEWEAKSDAISSTSLGIRRRKHLSSTTTDSSSNTPEREKVSDSYPHKAKLLEALCHSQTRAREAENAAKQAYTEKEHLLKLFYKQASHLFAYKQWLKLLQLENFLLRHNNSSSPSTVIPVLFPWILHKPKKPRKSWQRPDKGKQHKRASRGPDIGKCAVAFAVGFTLVGAGLILGWTIGWMLPAF